jgi:hypothetical protein
MFRFSPQIFAVCFVLIAGLNASATLGIDLSPVLESGPGGEIVERPWPKPTLVDHCDRMLASLELETKLQLSARERKYMMEFIQKHPEETKLILLMATRTPRIAENACTGNVAEQMRSVVESLAQKSQPN